MLGELRPGQLDPFGHPRGELVGRQVLPGHDLRFLPVPVEGEGVGEVLPRLDAVVARANRIGHQLDAAFRLSGERIGEAEVARGDRIVPVAQHGHGFGVLALAGERERYPQRGAGRVVAQRHRVVEAGHGGAEAARLEIGGAERRAIGGVARIGRNRGFGLLNRFVGLARGGRGLDPTGGLAIAEPGEHSTLRGASR